MIDSKLSVNFWNPKSMWFFMMMWVGFGAQLGAVSENSAEEIRESTKGVELTFLNWTNYDGQNMQHEEGGRELFMVWEGEDILDSPQYAEHLITEDAVVIQSNNIPLPFEGPFHLDFPIKLYRWKDGTKLKVAQFIYRVYVIGSSTNFRPEVALVVDYTKHYVDLYLFDLETEKHAWIAAVSKEYW